MENAKDTKAERKKKIVQSSREFSIFLLHRDSGAIVITNTLNMPVHPHAGKLPAEDMLVNIPRLVTEYYTLKPDPVVREHMVSFGTSGHRGSSHSSSFNEQHILAVTQAICLYRIKENITGPLFLGMDTHALSEPAFITVLEVLAANGVDVMIADDGQRYTPTPVVSHAILTWNRTNQKKLADGILLTPSHNPPSDGGIKYNPPHGGPADKDTTLWIENEANRLLEDGLKGVKRVSVRPDALLPAIHRHDYRKDYIADLGNLIDFSAISSSGIRLGVDPLGGAGLSYWEHIADAYRLDLTVLNKTIDPTFRFMSVDHDGKIRMDPSSPYTMQTLIGKKDEFDIAFACDTDYDRHGIVTRSSGLLQPNHFLSACIDYLFRHRQNWPADAMVGKTLVSSSMIDRVAARLQRKVFEVPVGFKWFVDGLRDGCLGFAGEESAGATFLRKDGSAWTTDKDGFALTLLAAEITARTGSDPGALYRGLTRELGEPLYRRTDVPCEPADKEKLKQLSPDNIRSDELAGEAVRSILSHAPGNGAAIGGIKVGTDNGWFAARPSGTENIYKIYAESFLGDDHLDRLAEEAQELVDEVLRGGDSES